ncbi:unnamed protein product [Ostreobium quekettii]|uniref:Serine aminopeptidase S33 domain-containing protein n=1 Tax=Ostreobium quekettii TaxID=121088 RepID=A0A8S1IPL5_9CHLO|nr:unnamed protein product [Ostreobium quekettii]
MPPSRGGPSRTPTSRSVAGPPRGASSRSYPVPPGATQRRVQFKNRFNENLVGIFVESQSPSAVILCHGFASHKDWPHYPLVAAELAKRSVCSLRFDFSGNGESQGVFEFGNYAKEVGEVRAAVEYVRGQLGKKVVGLAGHSKGGNVVLLYTSQHDDVPLVVNIAGRFEMTRGIAERFGADIFQKLEKHGKVEMTQRLRPEEGGGGQFKWTLTKQSMAERMNTDMEAAARKIKLSEVLTVHGTADQVIPVEDSQRFSECIKPHSLFTIDDANHNFANPVHAQAMIQKITNFFTSGL